MSYDTTIGNLGTYLMNMSALGLNNNIASIGYLPFSNVLSGVLGTLSMNALNTQNITGLRTISADSGLQSELNKLGYGNMIILIPEEYQKQVEENPENSQKIGETFKRWKTNYDTVNSEKSQTRRSEGTRGAITGVSHDHHLGNCSFGMRI